MVTVVVEGHDLHFGVVSPNHRAEVVADEIRLGGRRRGGRRGAVGRRDTQTHQTTQNTA